MNKPEGPLAALHPKNWEILRYGKSGPQVAAWQAVLEDAGYDITDETGKFDKSTDNATKSFQIRHHLKVDGIVGPMTRSKIGIKTGLTEMPNPAYSWRLPYIPMIESRWFTKADRESVDWLVVHCMDGSETADKAEQVAKRFARPDARKASYHYGIDNDSIIQCVREQDVAWHAPGANRKGIGIEHAGRARQTKAQWLDDYGKRMLTLSSALAADICLRWDIPIRYVDHNGLLRGDRGITTHAAASLAWKRSTHWDPGPGFPMAMFVNRVRACAMYRTKRAPIS